MEHTSPGFYPKFIRKQLKDFQVEREVGGGIGMGNTCKSMADSSQYMTKNTTIL